MPIATAKFILSMCFIFKVQLSLSDTDTESSVAKNINDLRRTSVKYVMLDSWSRGKKINLLVTDQIRFLKT
jgi:hypothetical protein